MKLRDATLVGFSTGGGEVARYVGRHGTDRIAQVALVGAVTPLMLKTPDNPNGVPIDVFDGLREGSRADRSQLYRDLANGPFFGANRPDAQVSQGMKDTFWPQSMQAGHKAAYDSIKAFAETDLTEASSASTYPPSSSTAATTRSSRSKAPPRKPTKSSPTPPSRSTPTAPTA